MPKFVELWIYLSATPLLWSVVTLACALLATGVSYPTYFAGAQFISCWGLRWWCWAGRPVAMGIAEQIGGIAALAAVFAVITGLIGALCGKYLVAALRIPTDTHGWAARGFTLGTARPRPGRGAGHAGQRRCGRLCRAGPGAAGGAGFAVAAAGVQAVLKLQAT